MARTQKLSKNTSRVYRSLVATAFITSGVFQFVAPVLAQGTAAGQEINNTATATYEDATGKKFNATSNTVKVTVEEVAGITVTNVGDPTFKTDNDATGANAADGKINNGDTLYFTYEVKNTGNDPTKIRIPDQPGIEGNATLDGNVEFQYKGETTWNNVASGGTITNSVKSGDTILVRVPVKIDGNASNNEVITVQLGNTPSKNDQNIQRNDTANDLYTVDNTGTTNGDIDGDPVNGVREASNFQTVTVNANLSTYTLATVLKSAPTHTVAGAAGPSEDTLEYGLSLRVEKNDPTGNGITAADLQGTTINVDNTDGTYILISDAVPAGTEIDGTPTAPAGWEAVYTEDDVTTDANAAKWKKFSTAAPDPANVKRVGFIKTGTIPADGTTLTGFKIKVKVKTTASAKLSIANIAQLFGASPTNNPVYDESGDQNPSNWNGTKFPGDSGDADIIPDVPTGADKFMPADQVDDGYIDPTDADTNNIPDELEGANGVGIDPGNNSGTDTATSSAVGEANLFTITNIVAGVLNGPVDKPAAIGPNGDNNKDFTNKSALVPAGTKPGEKIDPENIGFNNTIQNTSNADADISLIPTPPATAGDLPTNTLVTITYQSLSATYKYNGSAFVYDATAGNSGTTANNPVKITGVAKNTGKATYGVEVNLPPNTELSTDIEKGFPVPITAFVDTTTANGTPDVAEAQNITIDRVYTGFLKLVKESGIVQPNGSVTYNSTAKKVKPGDTIAYQIKAKNISEANTGTDNVILDAKKVEITEDGTTYHKDNNPGGNNWAKDNDGNGAMDTSHVNGKVSAPDATVSFFTGDPAIIPSPSEQASITKYVVNYLNVIIGPGQEKIFTFQRKVEATQPSGTANNPPTL